MLLVLSLSRTSLATNPVPVGGPTGELFTFDPALSDEFDSQSIDSSKWTTSVPPSFTVGRWPSYYMPGNSQIAASSGASDGSSLKVTLKAGGLPTPTPTDPTNGAYQYSTGVVMSTALSGYGYYEARIETAHVKADSAFWLDSPTNSSWEEIDIMEQLGTNNYDGTGNRIKSYHVAAHSAAGSAAGTDPADWYQTPSDLTSGYHVYGLSWTPSTIDWYFDGAQILQVPNTYWHDPQHIIFDLETNLTWAGTPESKLLPAAMNVDYFRMWTMTAVPEPSSLILLAIAAAWRCCLRSGDASKDRGRRLSVETLAAAAPHGVGE